MKLSRLIQRLQQLQQDTDEDLDVVNTDFDDFKSAYMCKDGEDSYIVLE